MTDPVAVTEPRHFLNQLSAVLHDSGYVLPYVLSYVGTFTDEGKPCLKVWMENGDAWEVTAAQVPADRWEMHVEGAKR